MPTQSESSHEVDARRLQAAEAIFFEALELNGADRQLVLGERCAGDPDLLAVVQRLLAGHSRCSGFLDPPKEGLRSNNAGAEERLDLTGHRVGRYLLRRRITSGGMGTVYEAEQDDPHRTVAIKVLRVGMAGSSASRRFREEAAILGRLNHPCIAQVYEAGTFPQHGESVPFFAMEYVQDARTITHFATGAQLDYRQRLELFLQVCDAVHHGHQQSVIHRDLKPDNILVDETGCPKVIDFGVARVLEADRGLTMQTVAGQLIGTLAYASPEQIEGNPDRVDIRADIYALGMVLHELLCGKLPYSVQDLPITEAATVIKQTHPRRLSTFDRSLRGDLETIVFKALAKEPDARYQSISEFAGDIRSYLRNEPIRARPASALYQFRKFARRNRALVAAAALAVSSLLLAVVISVEFGLREARQRQRAEQIAVLESAQRHKAEAVKAYLIELLSAADPDLAAGEEVTVREILDRFATRLADDPLAEPSIASEMHAVIGTTYDNLGKFDRAERHFREALRLAEQEKTSGTAGAEAQRNLGIVLAELGEFVEAERCQQAAMTQFRAALGPNHPQVAESLVALGELFRLQGRSDEAIDVIHQAVAIYQEHPAADNGLAANELGILYSDVGRYEESDFWYTRGHERMRAHFGPDHKHVASALNNRATLYYDLGRHDEAIDLFREALQVYTRLLGDDHVLVAHAENNLGVVLRYTGRYPEARQHLEAALAVYRRNLGDDNPTVANGLNNVGSVLIALGEYEQAARHLNEALDLRVRTLPPGHPDIAATRINLARLCRARNELEEAKEHLDVALTMANEHLTTEHPIRAHVLDLLGEIEVLQSNWETAEVHLRAARAVWQAQGIQNSVNAMRTESSLGVALTGQRKFAEAEKTLLAARARLAKQLGGDAEPVGSVEERLVALYIAWGKPEAAAAYRPDSTQPAVP